MRTLMCVLGGGGMERRNCHTINPPFPAALCTMSAFASSRVLATVSVVRNVWCASVHANCRQWMSKNACSLHTMATAYGAASAGVDNEPLEEW